MNQQPIETGLRDLAELAGPHQIDLEHVAHRIRRRRRTRVAVASGAACALVAVGGWLLPALLSGGTATVPVPPAASPAAPAPTAAASFPDLPLPTPEPLDAGAQQVADILGRVLPSGRLTVMGGRGLHDKGMASPFGSGTYEPTAWGLYDDGHGLSEVSVDLTRWANPDTTRFPYVCKPDPGTPALGQCQVVHLSGGGVVGINTVPAEGFSAASWWATYAAPDGARVVLEEVNAPEEKGYKPTRPQPPFSFTQLAQLASSPLWKPLLEAIRASGAQGADVNTPFGPDGIGAIFYRLIPSGFTRSGFAGDPSLGNTMVLSDAQGKGSVYGGGMSGGPTPSAALAAFQRDYPNATRLPDGSWLGTEEVPGEGGPGTEQYWVAVQRGETRVVVVALNSVGLKGPKTRPTPVLTIAQLTAIAESPTWRGAM
ncbi:hypothetical protein [Streptacidiphilus neutrinimicus]|uniref:hypothetical protein n=1 Tax=Streptacidiphilus neutrinimicus TaxID=105420 RepID=UPI0005A982C6|nr:hypothetical protein [Streptacidiphilus neutrinimicus]